MGFDSLFDEIEPTGFGLISLALGNTYGNIYSKKEYNLSMHSHAKHGNESNLK